MKLTVLVDNNTLIDRYYLGEPGVSYYIEEKGASYLLDTGYSDVFLRNAEALQLNLTKLQSIILSHGHNDHTGGLSFLCSRYAYPQFKQTELVAHPWTFYPKRYHGQDIGSVLTRAEAEAYFKLHLTREPYWLSEKLVFLGEIPRKNSFEAKNPLGETAVEGVWQPDFVWDDSALAYLSQDGLVIITGCSHAGICNIVAYARQVCQEQKVAAIIGGTHLRRANLTRLCETRKFLAALKPQAVYACHCTDLEAKINLAGELPVREVGVGQVLEFA